MLNPLILPSSQMSPPADEPLFSACGDPVILKRRIGVVLLIFGVIQRRLPRDPLLPFPLTISRSDA